MDLGMRERLFVAMLALGMSGCDVGGDGGGAWNATAQLPQEPASLRMHRARADVLRAELDPRRGVLWTLETRGVGVHDAATGATLRVIGLPGWMVVGEAYACPPGMAFGPGGHPFVTSNVTPALWRVDADTFEVTRHDVAVEAAGAKDVGFTGLAYWPRHDAFFAVNGLDGVLWRIDAKLDRAEPVPLAQRMPAACSVSPIEGGGVAIDGGDREAVALCVRTDGGTWVVIPGDGRRLATARPSPCRAAMGEASPS